MRLLRPPTHRPLLIFCFSDVVWRLSAYYRLIAAFPIRLARLVFFVEVCIASDRLLSALITALLVV